MLRGRQILKAMPTLENLGHKAGRARPERLLFDLTVRAGLFQVIPSVYSLLKALSLHVQEKANVPRVKAHNGEHLLERWTQTRVLVFSSLSIQCAEFLPTVGLVLKW